MKSQFLFFLSLILTMILNACAPSVVPGSTQDSDAATPPAALPVTGYQPVQVDGAEVEIGVGSPIPVQAIVMGSLPDTCAQIELIQQKQVGSHFEIAMSTIPSGAESCARDTLPFRMEIPLNTTNLPAGSYSVEVNGVAADFQLETGNTTSSQPAPDSVIRKEDIEVANVNVEVGVGSPIPVHAIVGVNLPGSCAQLGEIRLHREGTTFYVRLIADIAERSDCREDSIPFVLKLPLNILNLPEGPYEVNVNGVTASFDPRTTTTSNSDSQSFESQPCSEPVEVPVLNGRVSYDGISFEIDPSLGQGLAARSCAATTAEEGQMIHEVHPPYTEFFFPAFSRANVDFRPQIRVYEVTGDLESYLFPINSLDELGSTLEQRPDPILWFQNSPLHAREAYLDFANGAGVRGLLQYMQDYFFYTNNGLIYEFHGLTQDGRHFVNVRYPVSVPFLMELDGFTLPPNNINPNAIGILEWPGEYEDQRRVIEIYNNEALTRFEQMSDGDVNPRLDLLDGLVRSIQVSQP